MKMTRATGLAALAVLLMLAPVVLGAPKKAAKDAGATWTEDYAAAVALSKKTGKPILIDFTGSDWCGYCIKQHAEVYDTKAFQDWAKENVILVVADYPNAKNQTAKVKKQNEELKTKYGPKGYPTILFVDAKGTELGRWAGYGPGSGPDKWIAQAKPIVEKAKEATATK